MSSKYEYLSAFTDGELPEGDTRRVLDHLMRDSAMAAKWTRLHTIRQLLRDRGTRLAKDDFIQRVALALEAEPIIMVPAHANSRQAPLPMWGKFGAVAVAASVGFVSFVLLQPGQTGLNQAGTSLSAPFMGQANTVNNISPASMDSTIISSGGGRWSPLNAQPENSLESYLAQQRNEGLHVEQAKARQPLEQRVNH